MGSIPRKSPEFQLPQGLVPIGTTKCTYKIGLDSNARVKRDFQTLEPQTFPKNPTDHISMDTETIKRPFQSVFDEMVKKQNFDRNSSSLSGWEPKTLTERSANGCSSQSYDIITGDPNKYSPQISKSALSNKKYGRVNNITGIRDLLHGSKSNSSKAYDSAFRSNPNVFARKDGIFTSVYDQAARHG